MNFTQPTTKAEMINTLKEIFYFYRIRREGFDDIELEDLSLTRMTYVQPAAADIRLKAEKLLAPSQKLRLLNYRKEISAKKDALTEESQAISSETQTLIAAINANYAESAQEIENEAVKKGIAHGSVVIDRLAVLTAKKNAEITAVNTAQQAKADKLAAEISALDTLLTDSATYFSEVCEAEIQAKITELNDKEEEKQIEVFKYNNGLSEKEQRYANSLLVKNASLHLQHMEIISDFYTKDELVEMGYYSDALSCVMGYYNTLSASAAYNDIVADRELPVYLDDYYSNLVYLYRTRAGQ